MTQIPWNFHVYAIREKDTSNYLPEIKYKRGYILTTSLNLLVVLSALDCSSPNTVPDVP